MSSPGSRLIFITLIRFPLLLWKGVCKPTAETGTGELDSTTKCLLNYGTYQVGIHATDVTSKMRHTTAPAQLADYDLQDIRREGAPILFI